MMAGTHTKQPLIDPPPGSPRHPDGRGYYGFDHKGRPICAARTRNGTPCKLFPVTGTRRCKYHGGLSLSGSDNPNYKHGKYIPTNRNLPALGVLIEQQMSDPDWLTMQGEVAALRARFEQQVQRLATLQPSIAAKQGREAFRALQEGNQLLTDAVLNPNAPAAADRLRDGRAKLAEAEQTLKTALKRVNVELETWTELRDTTDAIKGALAHEMQRERVEKQFISGVDFVRFMVTLRDVVLEVVPDAKDRMKIADAMNRILAEQKLLVGGE